MEKEYNFKIITPQSVFYDNDVVSLVVPGTDGSFGILCNHAPIIATVDEGLLKIKEKDGKEVCLKIGTGYFDMLYNNAVLITEQAEVSNEVSK